MKFSSEFLRYLAAGLLNTAVGYLAFLLAFHLLGLNALLANAVSYAVGLCCAYVVNALFVFRGARHSPQAVLRFLAGFCVAYAINFAVLQLALEAGMRAELAQLVAMASYTVSFYLINKRFVWKT